MTKTDAQRLLELADTLEACAEDAKRPEPLGGDFAKLQPPAIISLANAVLAIAAALRAIAEADDGPDNS